MEVAAAAVGGGEFIARGGSFSRAVLSSVRKGRRVAGSSPKWMEREGKGSKDKLLGVTAYQ